MRAVPSSERYPEPAPQADTLLVLAQRLKDAAAAAGRPEVAAKADEAIVLITAAPGSGDPGDADTDRGNAVVRILDGLGF